MRICLVTHRFVTTDGQGRVNREIARSLAATGHQVELVGGEFELDLAATPNVTCRPIHTPRHLPTALLRYVWFACAAWRRLREIRRDGPVDVLVLNGAITFSRCDVNVANFVHADWARSPFHPGRTISASGIYQRLFTALNARWERRAFRGARRVVAVSDRVREALIEHAGVDPRKIQVIPPGVDLTHFRPLRAGETNALRQAIGLDTGGQEVVLLFVGDAKSNRKNLYAVIAAMPALPAHVRLAIVGDAEGGPYPAMAARLDVATRVTFLGPRSDVPELMRGADVFVFPSHYDPFALVVTEAMGSGVPVITAQNVGAATLIEHGRTGMVIPKSDDAAALFHAIELLVRDPAYRAQIASAARAAATDCTWASMARRYEALFEASRQPDAIPAKPAVTS